MGTCVTGGPWPDVAHDDIDGQPRAACAFDTPALRGLSDSAPYLHDGSAATLDDGDPHHAPGDGAFVYNAARGSRPDDRQALVEYLRSL